MVVCLEMRDVEIMFVVMMVIRIVESVLILGLMLRWIDD